MAISTLRALGKRALQAANLLDYWANELINVAEAQDVKWFSSRDPETTVALPKHTLKNMVLNMQEMANEIRRFKDGVK
jgi:hypothetical protein